MEPISGRRTVMPKYTQDWFTFNIERLNQLLDGFKGVDNIRMLEIGAFEGRSTNWFCENILTGRSTSMTVIDPFTGSNEYRMPDDNTGLYDRFMDNTSDKDIEVIKDISLHGLVELRRLERKFELIYVDGSHTSDDVMLDAILSYPMLTVGGVIIFDDYLWHNEGKAHVISRPKLAIDTFSNMYQGSMALVMRGSQIAFHKVREIKEIKEATQDRSLHVL